MPAPDTAEPIESPTPFYLNFLWACNLAWTLLLLGVNLAEFLLKGQWTYHGPGSLIYFATLAAYAGAKETHQWTQGESQAEIKGRKGVLFVAVWAVFSMGAFLAINLGQGYVFPHELLTITLEVLGIFFGTQASRALRRGRGKAGTEAVKQDLEERILQLARETGGIQPSDISERLGATRGEAQYALKKLVQDGKLRRIGENTAPDTKYVAV